MNIETCLVEVTALRHSVLVLHTLVEQAKSNIQRVVRDLPSENRFPHFIRLDCKQKKLFIQRIRNENSFIYHLMNNFDFNV